MTWWKNPTTETVRFRIFEGPGAYLPVEIPPGGAVDIPSEHDGGMQKWRDGRCVSGIAMNLVRLPGPPEPEPEEKKVEEAPAPPPRKGRKASEI